MPELKLTMRMQEQWTVSPTGNRHIEVSQDQLERLTIAFRAHAYWQDYIKEQLRASQPR